MTNLRRSVCMLAAASLVVGCPALDYDPPYRAVEGDAAPESDATAIDVVRSDAGQDAMLEARPAEAGPDGGPRDAAAGDDVTGDDAGQVDAGP
ncbi:MAG TPA: hypothetical protein VK762_33595, partial [Polyangiaceae bacterium]|nr:hypothetical protein [Polyangiaceae bacterium]